MHSTALPRTGRPFPRLALTILILLTPAARGAQAENPPGFESLNAALGFPLWQDDNLWDDDIGGVAQRLLLPSESETPYDRCYRQYPLPETRWLGARPFEITLLGNRTQPARLSMVFANRANLVISHDPGPTATPRERRKALQDLRDEERALPGAMRSDETAITTALTALLGPSSPGTHPPPGHKGDRTKLWTWKGHELLCTTGDNYVAFRIIPGRATEIATATEAQVAALRQDLLARVTYRANGDAVLSALPRVAPGPRSHSSQAATESLLRYFGVPSDLYLLAMQGYGGWEGTLAAARTGLRPRGIRVEPFRPPLRPTNIRRQIDLGIPLLWALWDVPEPEGNIKQRNAQRAETGDPAIWKAALKNWRKVTKHISIPPNSGARVALIIGYNEKTDEVAITDFSGLEGRTEQWLTPEELSALSQAGPAALDF